VVALEEAYQLAVVNEEQVAIAARELAKAKLLPWRAVALMAPRGEIGGAYSRNKDEIAFNAPPEARSLFGGSSVIRPRNNWLSTFQVTQPLIEPSFFPSWRLGKDAVREEKERYEFTIRSVLFGVAQAYYEVLRFEAQVKVAQDTLKLAQEELKRAYVRFRVGEVTKTDILRAEVAVERASRALVVDRNRLKLARTVLARTVGLSETVGVLEPTPPQAVESDYTSLLDQAYAQRQDLRAQNLAVRVARERKNLVLTRYFPQVDAQFSYPRLDPETFANRDEFWTLFVNLRWPLFDGGNRELDLLEANETLSQTELRVTELEKEIRVEVREALLSVETLHATLETLHKEVALARENYEMTSKQYRVGLSTSLDVNTSLNTLNQVRTQLIDQTYTYQIALLNLDNAVGVFAQDYLPQR
jgi:outer membrane protein